ncbi:PQQ-like beta-propeller repeat protein [Opitutia bacterium ISCC 51]|nr:PQQ-like beta-propeller repeat protein [Opitutae bacterium ISCC 51]QXD29999.1 PQQ-like beta-propeller repeat protein [Opitutae bacterium ISCC 52]
MNKFLTVSTLIFITSSLSSEDWPQWRGQDRDGTWKETGIVDSFPSDRLEPVWSTPVGSGYSGPTVSNGRVYLTSHLEEPDQLEQIHCVDEKTGKEIWKYVYPCVYQDLSYPLGPRAAVAIHDGKAYALGAMGNFHCLDASTGELIWKKDLLEEYDANNPVWGITSSPLIDDQNVYLQVGGQPDACIVALEKDTGEESWRALDGLASYSAPKFIEQTGKRLVLVWTGDWFAALNPDDGSPAWKHVFDRAKMPINVADPILDTDNQRIFLSSFYDGSYFYQLKDDSFESELIWERRGRSEIKTDALHSIISTSVIRGNYVYGIDSYGEFRCLDLTNGDRVWNDQTLLEKGRWATAFLVQNGERTWIFTEKGELIIANLSPKGWERISSTHLIEPTTFLPRRSGNILWSHPAYANKHIFVRNDQELRAFDLSK